MIDIEAQVYTKVATTLTSTYSGIWVTGEYTPTPPKFPAVMLIEMENVPYRRSLTQSSDENHAILMYELNVYSNRAKGRKSECKAIASTADEVMRSLGFTRAFLNPMPNLNDSTIYRITARYEAIVSKDEVIYRR